MFRSRPWCRTVAKSLVRSLVVILGVVGVAVVSTPSAAAQDALTCVSSADHRYSPGLHLTPQTVHIRIDGMLDPCTDLSGQSITAGSYGASFHAVRSCADLVAPSTGQFTITWNGGTHGFSTISFTRTTTIVGGNIVTTEVGTVVAGDFAGQHTLFETVGAHDPFDCATSNGVTLVHTNGNLTISPV